MANPAVGTLKQSLRGSVIEKDDPDYAEACKLYNGMIDKRPSMIARCTDVADVIATVRFARENDLLLAVRGGGHNGPGLGSCDDGVVIDLSLMKGVQRRSRGASCARRPWLYPGRHGPCDPCLRPRGAGGHRFDDRRRRPDIGRRVRLPDPQVWPDDRQPGRGRCRAGGRQLRDRQWNAERGSVLGSARWRRQLRCRHPFRLPRPSGQHGVCRPDLLGSVAGAGDHALVSRLPAQGAAGAVRLPWPEDCAVHRSFPARDLGPAHLRADLLLRRHAGKKARRPCSRCGPRSPRRCSTG